MISIYHKRGEYTDIVFFGKYCFTIWYDGDFDYFDYNETLDTKIWSILCFSFEIMNYDY